MLAIGKKYTILVIVLTYFHLQPAQAYSKQMVLDSLLELYNEKDTSAYTINLLFKIYSEKLRTSKNQQESLYFLERAYEMSQVSNYSGGQCNYWNLKGKTARNAGFYIEAIDFHNKAMAIAENALLKHEKARTCNLLGQVYRRMDEYTSAINYHLNALNIGQNIEDLDIVAIATNSLGNCYLAIADFDRAKSYFEKAMDMFRNTNDKSGLALTYNNLGQVYQGKKIDHKALYYYQESLNIYESLDNERGIATCYNSLGNMYKHIGGYNKALENYKNALVINRALGDKLYISITELNIGEALYKLNSLENAAEHVNNGLKTAMLIGAKAQVQRGFEIHSCIKESENDYAKALELFKKSVVYKDSILNEKTQKEIARQQIIYDSQRQAARIHKLENERVAEKTIIKQREVILGTLALLILVSVIAFFVLKQNRTRKKANNELALKNKKIEETIQQLTSEINDRQQAENRIKQSLDEKEVLLSEIHHRVKNNLAIISGLLEMQSIKTQDATAKDVLKDSQMRIKSMSLIHEKLYQTGGTNAMIDFAPYIRELVENIRASYSALSIKVSVNYDLVNTSININTAIPLGLLLNEIITNAFKHAFKGREQGIITIKLSQGISDDYFLEMSDNGTGLHEDSEQKSSGSIGLILINTFVRQVKGVLEVNNQNGTHYLVKFKPLKDKGWDK